MNWQALRNLAEQGYAPRTVLDVGAHLGAFSRTFADVFPGCVPVMIEPNPHCADALARLPYECHAFAASDVNGDAELNLTSEWLQSTGASLYRENTHFFRDEVLEKVRIPRRRLDEVFAGRRFDVIKIDTQGAELDVLRGGRDVVSNADYVLIEVSLVEYNAGGAKAEDVFAELASLGFDCSGVLEFHRLKGVQDGALLQMDFLFENRARRSRGFMGVPQSVQGLAAQLAGQGCSDLARIVLRHAAGLSAPDPAALEALVGQDLARGNLPSALDMLLRLRDAAPGSPAFMRLLQAAITPSVETINGLLARHEHESAAAIATPLARLLPGIAELQRSAMAICASLSDAVGAGQFAQALLALKPDDRAAKRIAACAETIAAARPKEAEAARMGFFPPYGRHPLLALRDLHDATTEILRGTVEIADLSRAKFYVEESRTIEIEVPDSDGLPEWLKHYRVSMEAMDPAGLLDALPTDPMEAPPAFADASGAQLSKYSFLQRIADCGPSAIFFVAADAKYVDLYANHYINSVLQQCDVPHAIVLHIIGGAGRLAETAAALARTEANVLLMGDDFDAVSVQTKCYDTPPKGQYSHPAAHFQSARFQWLGWLLNSACKPVFVSDIDLLLQRGVADLLAREAASDIVLNENESSVSAGSRLTANLLLLNPTPAATHYVAGLKFYLDRHLARLEVSRWIDQFGLLMARHRLRLEWPAAKIGYFDTESDINNLMYRTYEKNPFRFLSLYHGFDMESLKTAA
jgi:FkbM family methyltransferase